MKRTATWTWSDPAWAVVVRLNTASTAERVVMALPKVQPTDSTAAEGSSPTSGNPAPSASGPEGFLQRGLQRIGTTVEFGSGNSSANASRPRTSSGAFGARGTSPDTARRARRSEDAGSLDEDDNEHDHHRHDEITNAKEEEETTVTDAEGWVYGDNKWENPSGKGGIGKVGFTSLCRAHPSRR